MMEKDRSQLVSSQMSIGYHPTSSLDEYYKKYYPKIFVDDVVAALIPYRVRSGSGFRVRIDPADRDLEYLIARGLGDPSHRLEDAVRNLFVSCASRVMIEGEAIYEIVYCSDPFDHSIVEFRLAPIHAQTLTKRRKKLIQRIPKSIARDLGVPSTIELIPDRIFAFRALSPVVGDLKGIMDSLSRFSGVFPTFVEVVDMKELGQFDSAEFDRAQLLAVAEATKAIGWNARGLFDENMLDYYRVHRDLVFQEFMVEFRAEILATLNQGLKTIGRQIGFTAMIKIEGLPTIEEVHKARVRLESGDGTFREILEPFRNR